MRDSPKKWALSGVVEDTVERSKMPNSCPTRYCAQTPVTQQVKNDSPNAKIPNVYGTSVNIDDSCAPGA